MRPSKCLTATLLCLALLPATAGTAAGDVGYQDQSFSGTGTPTGSKRAESVLWWNDGSWWANMWDRVSQDFHIFRLDQPTQTWMNTGVATDTRSNTHSDVLWSGGHLYVASHLFVNDETAAVAGSPAYLYRFSYDAATKRYSLDLGFPVQINNWKTETLVIDRDSTGTLWATWQQGNQIYLNRTLGGDDRSWGTPFAFPSADASVTVDDNSALVAFGGDKVGLMWSNQTSAKDAMFFAVHHDGDPATAWSPTERALQGPDSADDHINLKSLQTDGSGRVFAAVKTSFTSSSQPLIMLLVRKSNGSWSNAPITRVSDCPNRPLVLVDDENLMLHVFYTAPGPPGYSCTSSGGAIYEKTAMLNNVSFPTGRGTPVIVDADSPYVHDVSSTKQNVNSSTGIAVLAVNNRTAFYWHHFESLGTPPSTGAPTAAFTGSPTSGNAPLTVAFTDNSTGAPSSWSWNFGDGGSSTAQSPSHTYQSAGTYNVSLTASNANGSNTLTKPGYISVAPPSSTTTVTAPASADSYVREAAPSSNLGTATTVNTDGGTGTHEYGYFRFDVTGVSGSVTSAKLRAWVVNGSGNGPQIFATGNGWTELGLTWNNRPAPIGSPSDDKGSVASGAWLEYDVTPLVTGNGTYSFVTTDSSTDGMDVSSRETANKPVLVVTFAP